MTNWKYWIINIIALNFLLLDITLKKIFSTLVSGEYFVFNFPPPWGNILKLKLAVNDGIAFGLSLNYYLLFFLYLIIIPTLIYVLFKQYQNRHTYNVLALTLIIFGSLSNLIDRLFWGVVVDYIDLKYYTVFNLADVMIVVGVMIILLTEFTRGRFSQKIS